jgi:hypothetical protein
MPTGNGYAVGCEAIVPEGPHDRNLVRSAWGTGLSKIRPVRERWDECHP